MTSLRRLDFPSCKCKTLSRLFLHVYFSWFLYAQENIFVFRWRHREDWISRAVYIKRCLDCFYWRACLFINRQDIIFVHVWRHWEDWISPAIYVKRCLDWSYWRAFLSINRQDIIFVHVWRHWEFWYVPVVQPTGGILCLVTSDLFSGWVNFTHVDVYLLGRMYTSRMYSSRHASTPEDGDAYTGNSQAATISKANGAYLLNNNDDST